MTPPRVFSHTTSTTCGETPTRPSNRDARASLQSMCIWKLKNDWRAGAMSQRTQMRRRPTHASRPHDRGPVLTRRCRMTQGQERSDATATTHLLAAKSCADTLLLTCAGTNARAAPDWMPQNGRLVQPLADQIADLRRMGWEEIRRFWRIITCIRAPSLSKYLSSGAWEASSGRKCDLFNQAFWRHSYCGSFSRKEPTWRTTHSHASDCRATDVINRREKQRAETCCPRSGQRRS